jgi:hypothetical protein
MTDTITEHTDFLVPVDTDKEPIEWDGNDAQVHAVHSDREGHLISKQFGQFRADALVHHTLSPPHDHDLNPIAERVIGMISESAAVIKSDAGASEQLWPWLVQYAVDWHNATVTATGSSTADTQLSPSATRAGDFPRVDGI